MELFIKILRWCFLPLIIIVASHIISGLWDMIFREIDISFGPLGTYSMLYKQCLSNLTEGCVCTVLATLVAPSGKKIVSCIVPLLWISATILTICVAPSHWSGYVATISGCISSLFGVYLVKKYLLENK